MAILTTETTHAIKKEFEHLSGEVRLIHFTKPESLLFVPGAEQGLFKETRQLLEEVAALAPEKIRLEVHDIQEEPELAAGYGVTRAPATVMTGDAVKGRIRFFGIPSGYEFPTLIGGILEISQGATNLSPATREALAELPASVHIQVFVTPT